MSDWSLDRQPALNGNAPRVLLSLVLINRPLLRRPGRPHATHDWRGIRVDDGRLRACLTASTELKVLHAGGVHLEGPAWQASEQRLVFSDVVNRRLLGWYDDGRVEVLIEGAWFVNGNAVAGDGSIYHCEHGRRCISRSSPAAVGMPTPVASHYKERRLNSPNDLTLAPDGSVWFTDPIFGIVMPSQGALAEQELNHRSVYRLDPVTGAIRRIADFDQPNGIGFSPDGRTLYVSDTSVSLGEVPGFTAGTERSIYALDLAVDGSVINRRQFATPDRGYPDGMVVDARGWVWSSAADGVHIWSVAGEPLGFIPVPAVVSNLTFGGANGRRLFITASDRLFAINLAS